jgi:DNA-binding response OmpR family regulator
MPDPLPHHLTIALIKGDDLILQLLERWLAQAGQATRTVSEDDLQRQDAFDLIIADVASVAAAARRVAALRAAHGAPLLLMSVRFRHGAGHAATMAGQLGVDALLPKPFTRDDLLAAVVQALTP